MPATLPISNALELLDRSPMLLAVIEAGGTLRYANQALRSYAGWNDPDDLPGSWLDHVHPDDRAAVMACLESLLSEEDSLQGAFRLHAKAGDWHHVRATYRWAGPDKDDGILVAARDATNELAVSTAQENKAYDLEQRFHSVIRAMAEGVVVVNAKGTVTEVNRRAEQMLGLNAATWLGMDVNKVDWGAVDERGERIEPDALPITRVLRTGESVHRARMSVARSDGSRVWLSVNAEPIIKAAADTLHGAVVTFHDITEEREHDYEMRRSQQQLRVLTRRLHKAQEDERMRISREIHDELGQNLTTLRLDINWMRHNPEADGFAERGKRAVQQVTETIETVRRISRDLRPGILDHFGLGAALEWQAEQFTERTGIACTFTDHTDDAIADLPPDCATALFRIYQEALTNIIRHAKAQHVTTHLAIEDDELRLVIADDGRGIREGDIVPGESLGLLNMVERISPWHGSVDISGTPGEGTTVRVQLPYPPHLPSDTAP